MASLVLDHARVRSNPTLRGGEPVIEGTGTPIRAIAEYWKFGLSPEEIQTKLPHLKLAQVFDALSFYSEHMEEIDAAISANRIHEAETDFRARG